MNEKPSTTTPSFWQQSHTPESDPIQVVSENSHTKPIQYKVCTGVITDFSCCSTVLFSNSLLHNTTKNRWCLEDNLFVKVLQQAGNKTKDEFYTAWQHAAGRKQKLLRPGDIVRLPKGKLAKTKKSIQLTIIPDAKLVGNKTEMILQMITAFVNAIKKANQHGDKELTFAMLGSKEFNWQIEDAVILAGYALNKYLEKTKNNQIEVISLLIDDAKQVPNLNALFQKAVTSGQFTTRDGINVEYINSKINNLFIPHKKIIFCFDFDDCITKKGKGITGDVLRKIAPDKALATFKDNVKDGVPETFRTIFAHGHCIAIVSFNYSEELIRLHLSAVFEPEEVSQIMVKHRDDGLRIYNAHTDKNRFVELVVEKVLEDGDTIGSIRLYDDKQPNVDAFNNYFHRITAIPHYATLVGTNPKEPSYFKFLTDIMDELTLIDQVTSSTEFTRS